MLGTPANWAHAQIIRSKSGRQIVAREPVSRTHWLECEGSLWLFGDQSGDEQRAAATCQLAWEQSLPHPRPVPSMTHYWHPFADMASVATQGELVITRGEGAYVWDREGRRYFDAAGGLWYCNVGYGRDELAAAAAEQLRSMSAYSNFGDFATQPTLDLADRLSALAPVPESVAFFTSNGSDAVDSAVKLSRRYWQVIGHPERVGIVVREGAYHGMHVGGTGLAGIPANRAGYEGMRP